MDIIVYHPETEDEQAAFAIQVAKLHAEQIALYIERLKCPNEQKLALLDAIISELKSVA